MIRVLTIFEKIHVLFIITILLTTIITVEAVPNDYFSDNNNNHKIPSLGLSKSYHSDLKETNKIETKPIISFTENQGQLGSENIRFYVQGGGIWFSDNGVWFELKEEIPVKSLESRVESRESIFRGQGSEARGQGSSTPQTHTLPNPHTHTPIHKYKSVILKQEFVSANRIIPIGKERLSWNSNFFYGNVSEKWCTDVPNYGEVYYENLYDGIDLRYYSNEKGLKYDLIVHPGVDPSQIKIKYEGADNLNIDGSGNLMIKTPIKDIVDCDLVIYQEYEEIFHQIEGKFIKHNDLEYGFEILSTYNHKETLIIDPQIRLEFSTFFGGSFWDIPYDIGSDASGNIYITGFTGSTDFPTTNGANDTSFNGGARDIFVLKMDPVGAQLLYCTYIGGSSNDFGRGLAVDPAGNAFVIGDTYSSNFPTTAGALDRVVNGSIDAIIFKLDPSGANLLYSTFLGGDSTEEGRDIALDSSGNIYVTGNTFSSNFPTSSNAYKKSRISSWQWDIFVSKLNPTGSTLLYSTYMGGSNLNMAQGIAVDSAGFAYVTGYTDSTNFPVSPWAFDKTITMSHEKAFVFKLNKTASGLEFSTLVGGHMEDYAYDIVIDQIGYSYITGFTGSSTFPTTPGAFDESFNGYNGDAFITKVNLNGSALNFSTFVGGSNKEEGWGIDIDPYCNVYITGRTYSANFPKTPDAYNGTRGPYSAGYMFHLAANGSTMLYSTFIGGNSNETSNAIDLDPRGDILITGSTSSTDFPKTPGAYNTTTTGSTEAFVAKFSSRPLLNITSVSFLKDNEPASLAYSRLGYYTFRTNLIHTANLSDLGKVQLTLDPYGENIKLQWDYSTKQFTELSDPNDFISIDSSSKAYNIFAWWTIDFNITFNWNYPDEEVHDIQAYATSASVSPAWSNLTDLYCIENDLEFNGTLLVKGEDDRTIQHDDLIRGGEKLHWSGLIPVYENSSFYPPDDEFDIMVLDEDSSSWSCSPASGEAISVFTIAPNSTHSDGFTYSINISGIPPECDASEETLSVNIDGDNVTFSNPFPNEKSWQTTSGVLVGVNITDIGGGVIDGDSVMHSESTNNGESWSEWTTVYQLLSVKSMIVKDSIKLEEGMDNLIKWQALDSVGNGPAISEPYRVLVDMEDITFSNEWPAAHIHINFGTLRETVNRLPWTPGTAFIFRNRKFNG
ncbi:DUF7948 domain-containing protein, partial [[Eubacterium] cellulosolvens]